MTRPRPTPFTVAGPTLAPQPVGYLKKTLRFAKSYPRATSWRPTTGRQDEVASPGGVRVSWDRRFDAKCGWLGEWYLGPLRQMPAHDQPEARPHDRTDVPICLPPSQSRLLDVDAQVGTR